MNSNIEDKERYLRAKKKVNEIKALYIHIILAIILIPAFIYINYLIDGFTGFVWFWFPIGGIIISLILHVVTVFKIGSDWENRKIEELLEKEELSKDGTNGNESYRKRTL